MKCMLKMLKDVKVLNAIKLLKDVKILKAVKG